MAIIMHRISECCWKAGLKLFMKEVSGMFKYYCLPIRDLSSLFIQQGYLSVHCLSIRDFSQFTVNPLGILVSLSIRDLSQFTVISP